MISEQMTYQQIHEKLGVEKGRLRDEIKRMKAAGRLMEVLVFARPHLDKKRRRMFVLTASNGDLFSGADAG